jgi:hypothetical protein
LASPPKYCITQELEAIVPQNQTNSHVVIILVVSILSLIIIFALGALIYRKFIKSELTKDMSSRVGEIVANYANRITSQKKRQREKLV